jgi:uncharacterized protein (DUF885 family)
MSDPDVNALAAQLLDLQGRFDPLNATMLGVPGHDHELADVAPAAEQQIREAALQIAAECAASAPGGADALTAAVVVQQAEALVDRIDARMVEYTITDNNYVGPVATMLTLMPTVEIGDRDAGEAYLTRLRSVPGYLEAVLDRHRGGAAHGRTPVDRLVSKAIEHIERVLQAPVEDDPLWQPLAGVDDVALAKEGRALIETGVRPAIARYSATVRSELTGVARPDHRAGLCWIPGGDEAYAALSRVHTTTDLMPGDIHQLGIEAVARLRDEYAEIGSRVFHTADQAEIFRRMTTDPALRWGSAQELLESGRAAVARAEAAMADWFGLLPGRPVEISPVPPAEAPGAPAAYYHQPSLDGSRPGTYFANTHRAEARERYLSEVMAFHEAIPGHHLQLTIAIERTDLPLLRRLADINATIEGWALYSERLADEMGLYSDDLARLGMLAMDSLRAGRLVVDTGLHAHGWSRARAVAYLQENTPLALHEIEEEIDRYIAYAAQALSYMVGRLEIQRMRGEAERRLAGGFDIRAFHDVVLGSAPLPLSLLDQVVREWSAAVDEGDRLPAGAGG